MLDGQPHWARRSKLMWLALAQLREAELQATSYADDEGSHVAYGGNRVILV